MMRIHKYILAEPVSLILTLITPFCVHLPSSSDSDNYLADSTFKAFHEILNHCCFLIYISSAFHLKDAWNLDSSCFCKKAFFMLF
jgi:hypothetical protein